MSTYDHVGIEIPFGKSTGQVYTTCPKCSESRKKKKDKCLGVNLDLGVWHCNHCDWKGSIHKKQYVTPKWENRTILSDSLLEWFLKRNIGADVLNLMKITQDTVWMPQVQSSRGVIGFNYFRDGKLVNVKYRDRDKNFTFVKDAELILYNLDGIFGQKEIYITEGECDALVMIQAGFKNTCSVPNGANPKNNNLQYMDSCWQAFEKAEKVYIMTDNDDPGNQLADELARRIGPERCYRVRHEYKDVNDALNAGVKITKEWIDSVATYYPLVGVHQAETFWDELLSIRKNGFPKGWKPRGAFGEKVSIHPGYQTVITGVPGHGKALYLGMKIPTPTGFKTMADIVVGDIVFDEKGNQCNVVAIASWNDRPCYELEFSDGTKIIADENHEWLTDTWKSRRSESNKRRRGQHQLKVRGTDQSIKRTFAEVRTTLEIFKTLKTKNDNRNNHSIKLAGAIDIERKRLPIHPYVLGCWLGDGRTDYASITCADTEIIERIKCLGYEVSKQSEKYQYGLLGVVGKLKKLNLVGNKHIPNEYLFSSKSQRLELLKGLMDTDGSISKDSSCEFTSIKKELAESVKVLVCSLGIRATMIEGDAKIDGVFISKKYRVLFKPSFNVFFLKRKSKRITKGNRIDCRYIVSCKPIGNLPTKCIQVDSDSHLFLCSESFIPTHNSEHLDQLLIELGLDYELRGAYFSPENFPTSIHLIKIIEKITGRNFWELTTSEINDTKEWINEHIMWVYPDDGLNLTNILEHVRKAITRHGINWYVIDPWNKLDHQYEGSETSYISRCLDEMDNFNKKNNVHGFLVAHPTKMQKNEDGTYQVPNLYSISGSAHFFNKAALGWTVYKTGQGTSDIHVQKVKFKYWGEIGVVNYIWDSTNGRYYTVNPDRRNWLKKENELIPVSQLPYKDSDELPF